jgi:cell division protease FtsH
LLEKVMTVADAQEGSCALVKRSCISFLGPQPLEQRNRVYSEATAERVDREVERLIEQAHQQTRTVITERLARALLKDEVVERDQLLAIIAGE